MNRPGHQPKRYTVFEALNTKAQEIFVGATTLPMFETVASVRRAPPASIKHWDFDDLSFRSLEFNLEEQTARALVKRHVARKPAPGWRYLSGDLNEL